VLLSFVFKFHSFPRSVYILDALSTLFFLVLSLLTVRWIFTRSVDNSLGRNSPGKVLIFGAKEIGCQLDQCRENIRNNYHYYSEKYRCNYLLSLRGNRTV
jgi:hypothetical protein